AAPAADRRISLRLFSPLDRIRMIWKPFTLSLKEHELTPHQSHKIPDIGFYAEHLATNQPRASSIENSRAIPGASTGIL
ncbi:MAG: hypothetical protein D6681_02355, partial [Calditrichaeota bacterium]